MKRLVIREVYTLCEGNDLTLIPTDLATRLFAVSCMLALGACAATEPLEYQPRPDMDEVAKQLGCASDRTPTCIERINKPYTCYCADRELLREILDPDVD